ncbi:MAG: bifunctional phosphopantothenoylcysteine decarboxylase/phosphopantothenate--cysteine ligase CoaBC [Candidatus Margulisiibacteriota bacterium]
MLNGKTIIVGVTGGIAAYKSCELVSRLTKLGAEVWVVMTKEATKLVAPLTFRTLSTNPVITDLFAEEVAASPVPHIALAQRADAIIVAPCTANVIGKIAHGIADDALTTFVLAATGKKIIAPAMNGEMWRNPLVIENVKKLTSLGYEFIGPLEGKLACGVEDIGKMSEPAEIVEKVVGLIGSLPAKTPAPAAQPVRPVAQDLAGKRFLVTAGGTRESIDPVRYISNRSSGKMGYALAEAARARGAEVVLVSGPVSLNAPTGVKVVEVESAKEMLAAVKEHMSGQNVIVMAAAVADYRPKITFWQKLKKDKPTYTLELARTTDILGELAKRKNGTCLVGFAAETDQHLDNAREKLDGKNLDLIVVNDVAAFEADRSKVTLLDRSGGVQELPEMAKKEIAHRILDAILRL